MRSDARRHELAGWLRHCGWRVVTGTTEQDVVVAMANDRDFGLAVVELDDLRQDSIHGLFEMRGWFGGAEVPMLFFETADSEAFHSYLREQPHALVATSPRSFDELAELIERVLQR